jgi:plasmid stabilization system protein ParE
MTKPVRLVDAAREEFLTEVAKYGTGFTRAVRAAFKLIARFPEAWPAHPKRPGVRRYVMKRYPFVIVYRTLPAEIRVLAVAATKRRPGYWRGRK